MKDKLTQTDSIEISLDDLELTNGLTDPNPLNPEDKDLEEEDDDDEELEDDEDEELDLDDDSEY